MSFLDLIVRDVAEIPDRNSPEDQPEMMLVTTEELRRIVAKHVFGPMGDNHHNAAACPHCTHNGAFVMVPREDVPLMVAQPEFAWRKYPETKPEPNGDCRHLCVIVNGDYHHVGICSYQSERGGWWQNAGPVAGWVWAFMPLPEGYPTPPNSAQGLRMGLHGVTWEPLDETARDALTTWWNNSHRFNTGRNRAAPVEKLQGRKT